MENTDECIDEGQKAEVVCRKLMRKVYEIWRKTYDVRIRVSCFYNDVVLPLTYLEEKKENERLWKAEFDDFAERWKEIGEEKDEVDWLFIDLHETIEQEEKKRQKNKNKKTNIK